MANLIVDMKTAKFLHRVFLVLLILLSVSCSQHNVVRFGICADVHKDIMHDADQRLQAFISEMNEKDVDFIIELGDFAQPQDYNASFMNIWKSFKDPIYAIVEVDSRGIIRIAGRESSWLGPDPWELGYPEDERNKTGPRITCRELEF